MSITAQQLSQSIGHEVAQEFSDAMQQIEHCVEQLEDSQLWWRPDERLNSVANLLLHLSGNVRQWVIAGLGGAADVRDRPSEFSARGRDKKEALLQQLRDTLAESQSIVRQVTPQELLRVRRIQGFDVSGTQAMIECVAHFRGHTQEIVHITRRQLGASYASAFVPATVEQGAEPEADQGAE